MHGSCKKYIYVPEFKLAKWKSVKLIQKLMPLEAAIAQLYLPPVSGSLIVLPTKKQRELMVLLKLLLNFQK